MAYYRTTGDGDDETSGVGDDDTTTAAKYCSARADRSDFNTQNRYYHIVSVSGATTTV